MCIIVCMYVCVYVCILKGLKTTAEGKGLFQKSHPHVSLFMWNLPAERASSTPRGRIMGGQQLGKMIDLTVCSITYIYIWGNAQLVPAERYYILPNRLNPFPAYFHNCPLLTRQRRRSLKTSTSRDYLRFFVNSKFAENRSVIVVRNADFVLGFAIT